MERVKITGYIEVTDPNDPTGLTEEDYNTVSENLVDVIGMESFEIERVNE